MRQQLDREMFAQPFAPEILPVALIRDTRQSGCDARQQVFNPCIGEKAFLLAPDESEQLLRLAERAGNFGVPTQIDIAAGGGSACSHQAHSECAA